MAVGRVRDASNTSINIILAQVNILPIGRIPVETATSFFVTGGVA